MLLFGDSKIWRRFGDKPANKRYDHLSNLSHMSETRRLKWYWNVLKDAYEKPNGSLNILFSV